MSNLYLYNYNNYFNRIVKKESTLANYGTPIYSLLNTNFDMNDSVTATHTINYSNFDGDYVIITDNQNNIKSRWFVMENQKQRGGQHTLYLRRDLIVDNYDKVINAPCLINRAMIKDINNPLLYNSEGFNFNQIKQDEVLLTQKGSNVPWYAIYLPTNVTNKSGTITSSTSSGEYDYTTNEDLSLGSSLLHNGNQYYSFDLSNTFFTLNSIYDYNWASVYNNEKGIITTLYDDSEYPSIINVNWGNSISDYVWFDQPEVTVKSQLIDAFTNSYSDLYTALKTELNVQGTTITGTAEATLRSYVGREVKVKDSTGKIYKVRVTLTTKGSTGRSYYSDPDSGTLANKFIEKINTTTLTKTGDWGDRAFEYNYLYYSYTVSTVLVPVTSNSLDWSIDYTGANPVKTNAPYNVIFIPADTITVYNLPNIIVGDVEYTSATMTKEISEKVIMDIQKEYSDQLIDIQLLPYFPINDAISNLGLDYSKIDNKQFYIDILNGECILEYACVNIDYTFDIKLETVVPTRTGTVLQDDNRYLDYKISNECDVIRLVSPNYNGIFEFSIAKNRGTTYFNVDYTLRPYNPYIHINPDFKGLYGADYDDSRGLICQGDFSLPIVTDQFKAYENQNKNYLNVFNRQISHMDYEYGLQRTEAIFGATIGSLGAGISGGLVGGKVGGVGGAVAGAIGGTIASAIGGAVDYNILKQRQAENKDLIIDNFKYQLGNIKALPYTINKITPFTHNNKKFPFLEWYSCTETEIELLKDKIKYTSMNVNAIGTIREYLTTEKSYISGSLIRLENLDCQMHEAQELYDEIMKGVFI